MSSIELSIITVGYCSQLTLPALLNSITNQINCSLEFIYVENAPQFSSVSVVKKYYPSAVIIEPGDNLGFSKGCNIGAASAKGKYLLFLNPDCEIMTADTLKKMVQFMQDHLEVGICCPQFITGQGKKGSGVHFDYFGDKYVSNNFNGLAGNIAWVSGAALMTSQKLYKQINGFDERYFMHSDDIDICLMAREAGFEIAEVADTQIMHLGGHSSKALRKFETALVVEKSRRIFTEKHYSTEQNKVIWKKYRLKKVCDLLRCCFVHQHKIFSYISRLRAVNQVIKLHEIS